MRETPVSQILHTQFPIKKSERCEKRPQLWDPAPSKYTQLEDCTDARKLDQGPHMYNILILVIADAHTKTLRNVFVYVRVV